MRFLSALQPIRPTQELWNFTCGEPALDDWLKHRALKNESHFSRTYVIAEESNVIGFYSLSAGGVARATAPPRLRRNAPDPIPIAIIGRLAVDKRYGGQGLGTDLLMDALARCALASEALGIAAVVVNAKSIEARRFYLKQAEFLEYPTDSRTLYLPIETILGATSLSG